ncbi:MAG TPA: ABC transporter permease subunit [Acidimicrobiia bacterium]|nr:ABC transporter permease subunit [Acidimicrobiia bacterium]
MTVTDTKSLNQPELRPVQSRGWTGGLGNLVRKELDQWWGTRVWWIQLLIWTVILIGISTAILVEGQSNGSTPTELHQEMVQTFILVAGMAIGIGVVISVQGSVVGEKQSGTAAWVMSKPASRQSFVLAKVFAHTVGFWATALIIPAAIFLVGMRLLVSTPVDLSLFMAGLALVALIALFYIALTLMLGTMLDGSGPVAGIGIGFALAGMFFKDMLPQAFVRLTPWTLPDLAGAIALGGPLPAQWAVPVVAATVGVIVMIALALWRFGHEEL